MDAASHILLLRFLATRIPYCRAQLKPTVYCGSMVIGTASVRLSVPCLVSVTRLHIWPPVTVQPLSKAAWPQAWRCLNGELLLSVVFEVTPALRKSPS